LQSGIRIPFEFGPNDRASIRVLQEGRLFRAILYQRILCFLSSAYVGFSWSAMEFKNNYSRLCQDVKYKGPVVSVLKHLKDAVVAVDVDDFLAVRIIEHIECRFMNLVVGRAGSVSHCNR